MKTHSISLFIVLTLVSANVFSQNETLSNRTIIEMTAAELSSEIIISKIIKSETRFDTSAAGLIELKNSGVADPVIKIILERAETVLPGIPPRTLDKNAFSETVSDVNPASQSDESIVSPKEAVLMARTIAFMKSSANPSRQNLEKALLKNPNFRNTKLTILRYKDEADLFVEIGFVSGSWLTHRYVYRIFDRRSGAVLAAGETTSWGSLADNLAGHISRSLKQLNDR
jgi:hypothetical protein